MPSVVKNKIVNRIKHLRFIHKIYTSLVIHRVHQYGESMHYIRERWLYYGA